MTTTTTTTLTTMTPGDETDTACRREFRATSLRVGNESARRRRHRARAVGQAQSAADRVDALRARGKVRAPPPRLLRRLHIRFGHHFPAQSQSGGRATRCAVTPSHTRRGRTARAASHTDRASRSSPARPQPPAPASASLHYLCTHALRPWCVPAARLGGAAGILLLGVRVDVAHRPHVHARTPVRLGRCHDHRQSAPQVRTRRPARADPAARAAGPRFGQSPRPPLPAPPHPPRAG